MIHRSIDDDSEFEARVSVWLREAVKDDLGGTAPHLANVRRALLDRLETADPSPVRRLSFQRIVWPALAAAAAVILLTVMHPWSVPDAWAEVQRAVQERLWVHATAKLPNGKQAEFWISPQRGIAAFQSEEMTLWDDMRSGQRSTYNPTDKQLVISSIQHQLQDKFYADTRVFAALLRGDTKLSDLLRGVDVIGKESKEVQEGGQKWLEYTLTLRVAGEERPQLIVYRVDPATNLPVSIVRLDAAGQVQPGQRLDFPKSGPETIYALGVSPDVAVINRVPLPEVRRLVERRREVMRDFDSYYCVSVIVADVEPWWQSARVSRFWRDGTRGRWEESFADNVDLVQLKARPAPPEGTDRQAWWLAEVKNRRFRPVSLSDGKQAYAFPYTLDPKPTTEIRRLELHVSDAQPDDVLFDPGNPLPRATMSPDTLLYGLTGISSDKRESQLIASPESGPAGTVLLEVRDRHPRAGPFATDLWRYWLDPLRDGAARRQQMGSQADAEASRWEVTLTESGVTPKGFLYPKTMRFGQNATIYFYVVFNKAFAASVFDPTTKQPAPSP